VVELATFGCQTHNEGGSPCRWGPPRRRWARPVASAYDFDALDSALKIQREMAVLLRNLA